MKAILILLIGVFSMITFCVEGAARKISGAFNPENVAPRVYDFVISPNAGVPKVIYKANLEDFNIQGLYRVSPGGGPSVKISGDLAPGRDIVQFKISSDGVWTVFTAEKDKPDTIDLYSVPSDGGSVNKLNTDNLGIGQQVSTFQISPDGTKVVYLDDDTMVGVFNNLSMVPISGGSQALPLTAINDPNKA